MDIVQVVSKEIANCFSHGPALKRLRDALAHLSEACDARASYLECVLDEDDEMAKREMVRFRESAKRATRAMTSKATNTTTEGEIDHPSMEGKSIADCPVVSGR